MKHFLWILSFCLLIAQTSWAGRAQIPTLSNDPYASALIMDADTGKILFSENSDKSVYPASVVKLMDLLIMLERIEEGKNSLGEMVQVTNEAAQTGGSQVYLDPREKFSIEDLLYALAVQSANDAAVALAIHVTGSKEGFVELMNQKAAELGMKNTHFHSVHGLPPSTGQKPDTTTAEDIALLSHALVNRSDALQFTSTKVRGFRDDTFIMRTHNHLLNKVEGCDGLKTGYYGAAGFSIAATAKRGERRVIAVVMGSKNRKVRDAKAIEFLAKGFSLLPPKAATSKAMVKPTKPAPPSIEPQSAPDKNEQPTVTLAQTSEQGVSSPPRDWGMFFWGLITGITLVIVTLLFLKRRSSRARRNRFPKFGI